MDCPWSLCLCPAGSFYLSSGSLVLNKVQSAWLRNASIKGAQFHPQIVLNLISNVDNILFNLPYDEERYQKTLQVCALINDLEILEDGDESEIGERGVRPCSYSSDLR